MRHSLLRSLLAAIALLPTASIAADFEIGDLSILHPVAKAVSETAMTSAGFFSISNHGANDDALVDIRAGFPRVEMHDTMTNDDGIASMMKMDAVPLPAGETVTFERGAKHVMFMGLRGIALQEGHKVNAVLVFENAGELAIQFNVEDMQQTHDH